MPRDKNKPRVEPELLSYWVMKGCKPGVCIVCQQASQPSCVVCSDCRKAKPASNKRNHKRKVGKVVDYSNQPPSGKRKFAEICEDKQHVDDRSRTVEEPRDEKGDTSLLAKMTNREQVCQCDSMTQDKFDRIFFDMSGEIDFTLEPGSDEKSRARNLASFSFTYEKFKLMFESTQMNASGSYGVVSFYQENQYKVKVAVKRVKNTDLEVNAVTIINRLGVQCGTIKARIGPIVGDYQYIFLQQMDTDLSFFCRPENRLLDSEVGVVIGKVYSAVECLIRESKGELVYVDIKPENILVKLDKNRKPMVVALGDLGSCVGTKKGYAASYRYYPGIHEESEYDMSTYTKATKKRVQHIKNISKKKATRYFLGRMALDLLGVKYDEVFFATPFGREKAQAILNSRLGNMANDMLFPSAVNEHFLVTGNESSIKIKQPPNLC